MYIINYFVTIFDMFLYNEIYINVVSVNFVWYYRFSIGKSDKKFLSANPIKSLFCRCIKLFYLIYNFMSLYPKRLFDIVIYLSLSPYLIFFVILSLTILFDIMFFFLLSATILFIMITFCCRQIYFLVDL